MKKKRLIAWLMAIAMVIGVLSPVGGMKKVEAASATYYLSNTGNDSNDGKSADAAFLTLKRAFDVIKAEAGHGDHITIKVMGTVLVNEEAVLNKDCDVTIEPYETTAMLKRATAFKGSIIDVDGPVAEGYLNLILKNITLDGGVVWEQADTTKHVAPLERGDVPLAGGISGIKNRVDSETGNVNNQFVGTTENEMMDAALRISKGNVEVYDCVIQNNINMIGTYTEIDFLGKNPSAEYSPRGGGGIHVSQGSTLTINDSKICDNYARHQGGGIWNDGTLIVNDCEISGNRADDWGGGIYQLGGSTTVNGKNIHNNSAGGSGGGINIYYGNFDISNTDVYGNYLDIVWGNNEARGLGGAGIRVENYAGTVTLGDNVKVYGNSCKKLKDGSEGGNNETSATGLMLDKTADVTMSDTFLVIKNYVAKEDDDSKEPNQWYYDETDKYYKEVDPDTENLAEESNVGGKAYSTIPTVTISEDITLCIGQDNGTMTVTATPVGSETLTYQWYEQDASGSRPVEGATNPTLNVPPQDQIGEKYYFCQVTNTEPGKFPSSMTSETKKATTVDLVADDFIVKKADLTGINSLDETVRQADVRWDDGAAGIEIPDNQLNKITVEPKDATLTLDTIKAEMDATKDGGIYEIKYTFNKDPNVGWLHDDTTVNMIVVDEAGRNKDDSDNPIPQIGANNITISKKEADAIKNDTTNAKIKEDSGVVLVDDGKKQDDISNVGTAITDPDSFTNIGNHQVAFTYLTADPVTITVTVVDLTSKDFIVTTGELEDFTSLTETAVADYAGVEMDNGTAPTQVAPNDVNAKGNKSLPEMQAGGAGKKYTITYTDKKTGADTTAKMRVVDVTSGVKDGTDDNNGPHKVEIGAQKITVNESELLGKTNDDPKLKELLKELGNPVATEDGTFVPSDKIKVKDVKVFGDDGKLLDNPTVTFEYDNVTVDVPITVNKDVERLPFIVADDFIISVSDAKNATDDSIIDKSNAGVYDSKLADAKPTKDIDADEAALKSVTSPGDVAVKLESTGDRQGAEKTVTAHVVDETSDPKDNSTSGKDVTIGANNIEITVAQAKNLKGLTPAVQTALKDKVGAIATSDGTPVDRKEITVENNGINDAANSTGYPVVLGYDGKTVTVHVKVIDSNVTLDAKNEITVKETVLLGKSDPELQELMKELGEPVATDNGQPVDPKDIEVELDITNASDGSLKDSPKVTFKYGDKTKEVPVTIIKESETYPLIDAGDFIISVEDAQAAKPGDVKKESGAKLYTDFNKGDATAVDVKPESMTALNGVEGAKDVPINLTATTTTGNVEKTVTAHVVQITSDPNAPSDSGKNVEIGANDITLTVNQAKKLLGTADDVQSKLKEKTGVVATSDGSTVDKANIKVTDNMIRAEVRTKGYPVTFAYDGVPVTVLAKVIASDIDLTAEESITVKEDDITGKTDDELKDLFKNLGKPVATDNGIPVDDPENIETTVDLRKPDGTLKDNPTVTFKYEDKEVIVPIRVTKDSEEETKEPTLTAKDFEVPAGSPGLSEDDFKKKADVVAKDPDGKEVPAKVDPDDLKKLNDAIKDNKPGTYPVKVSTPDGKKTETVNVTVKAPEGTAATPADTTGEDKTYEISNPQDIPQDLDPGRTVDKITVDGKDLPEGSYAVDGNKLTIKPSAMDGKPVGKYPVVITYKDGSKRTFNVNVIDYDPATVVPLKKVPIFNMQKDIGVGKKFKLNLVGMNKNAYIDPKNTKTSNKKIATIDPKNLVIKANKRGKCNIQAAIIQNGSYYSVKIKLVVKKKMTMYNLKNAALVKKQGTLPEFNVYKRVVKGKKTKLKFTQVAKNAKITYTSSNKKVATISKKGVITGKKKGFTKVTAKIEQEGHVYYTRLFVRVDDGTKNKQLKKYLTTKVK